MRLARNKKTTTRTIVPTTTPSPRTGSFEITHWRTVNWHNLLTQQQHVVGDIFNLGPNESGKTTLMDGIHAALTLGEPHMEWNSAADPSASATRLRREGRTLRDIIFRVNQTWSNATPSIVYFAAEFTNRTTGEIYSIGVGAYAQTPKSDPIKWGFVIPEKLKDIQLTDETGDRVHDQETLEKLHGSHNVFGVRRFRQRIAEVFFGTLNDYDAVLELLNLGKSYNRLVQQSNNFSALFRSALPPPDPGDFESARAQLQSISAIRSAIESLRDQKTKLERIHASTIAVRNHRAALIRYDLRDIVTELEREEGRAKTARDALADLSTTRQETEAELERVNIGISTSSGIVRDLERTGVDDLQQSTEAAEEEHDKAAERLRIETLRAEDARQKVQAHVQAEESAWNALSKALSIVSKTVGDQRKILPKNASAAFPGLFSDIQADLRLPTPTEPGLPDALRVHLDNLDELILNEKNRIARERREVDDRLKEGTTALGRATTALDELALQRDIPPTPTLPQTIRGLEDQVHVAYQHLEYRPQRETDAALLEAYLPREVLAAILPIAAETTDRIRSLVEARTPYAKIVDVESLQLRPIPSDSILHALDHERTHPDVLCYLVAEYGEVRLRDVGAPRLHGERVVWKNGEVFDGHAWMMADVQTKPRFIGKDAREQLKLQRKAELEAEIALHEKAIAEIEKEQARLLNESNSFETVRTEVKTAINRTRLNQTAAHAQTIRGELSGLRIILANQEAAMERERVEWSGRRDRLAALKKRAEETGAAEKLALLSAARQKLSGLRLKQIELEKALNLIDYKAGEQKIIRDNATANIGPLQVTRDQKLAVLASTLQLTAAEVEAHLRETGFARLKNVEQKRAEANTAVGEEQKEIENALVLLSAKRSLRYDREKNTVYEAIGNRPLGDILTHLESSLADKDIENVEATRILSEQIIVAGIAATIKEAADEMIERVEKVNKQLQTADFRGVIFRIRHTPVSDPKTAQLRKLVMESSAEASQETLADFIRVHLETTADQTEIPALFDYREWYDFAISTVGASEDPSEDRTSKGSGGRQAAPKYLFMFCLFSLLYDRINARLRLVLIDEAFQRIDPGNIDQLIRFAKKRGLLLVVTNTELDGATEAMGASTVNMFHKNDRDETFVLPWTKMATGVYAR